MNSKQFQKQDCEKNRVIELEQSVRVARSNYYGEFVATFDMELTLYLSKVERKAGLWFPYNQNLVYSYMGENITHELDKFRSPKKLPQIGRSEMPTELKRIKDLQVARLCQPQHCCQTEVAVTAASNYSTTIFPAHLLNFQELSKITPAFKSLGSPLFDGYKVTAKLGESREPLGDFYPLQPSTWGEKPFCYSLSRVQGRYSQEKQVLWASYSAEDSLDYVWKLGYKKKQGKALERQLKAQDLFTQMIQDFWTLHYSDKTRDFLDL